MADLPGHLVATTSTCTLKLERLTKLEHEAIVTSKNELIENVLQFLIEIIIVVEYKLQYTFPSYKGRHATTFPAESSF